MRTMNGPSSMRTARDGCASTILPFSCPLYVAKSASLAIAARTTSGRHHTVGAGRPRLRKADERLDLRRDEVRAEPFERPAPPEVPVLAMDVREPPLRHLLHRPRARFVDRRRAG